MLIAAVMFREANTNVGMRGPVERMANVFCEQFLRARAAGITDGSTCSFPLTQTQLGQLLAMSLVSVNRALQRLRRDRSMELRDGRLTVTNLDKLKARANFDPTYLHLELRAGRMGSS